MEWIYNFEIIPNQEFVSKVQINETTTISQPIIGTVIDNKLMVFPTPNEESDGDILELWATLSSGISDISELVIPDLPEMWDKALEYFATAQFLVGDARIYFMNEFNKEVRRLRAIDKRNDTPLQRENAFDCSSNNNNYYIGSGSAY